MVSKIIGVETKSELKEVDSGLAYYAHAFLTEKEGAYKSDFTKIQIKNFLSRTLGSVITEDASKLIVKHQKPNFVKDGIRIYGSESIPSDMIIAGEKALEVLK